MEILINNAAIYTHGSWLDDKPADMLKLYDVNVVGAARLIQYLVPQMRERHWGRIIQIASGDATEPLAFMSAYAATKAALVNLTVGLVEVAGEHRDHRQHRQPRHHRHQRGETVLQGMAARFGWGSDWGDD